MDASRRSVSAPSSKAGQLLSNRRSTTMKKTGRSSTKAFALGSPVKVHFGARDFTARVLGFANDRVTVEINVDEAADPIITSYSAHDVKAVN